MGYMGTDTLEEASELPVVSSGGEVEIEGVESELHEWTTPDFEQVGSEGFVDDTARMRYRIGLLENEIAEFHKVRHQLRHAQNMVGADDLSSLLATIDTIQNDFEELEAQVGRNQLDEEENSAKEDIQDTDEANDAGKFGSPEMYIKLSQLVFVALGIFSIYLSITLQNDTWAIVATFAVPILFVLAFGGIAAERAQLGVNNGNNVS